MIKYFVFIGLSWFTGNIAGNNIPRNLLQTGF